MARTRDPRPNSDSEEHQVTARVTRAQNQRVYEESELSAAESLMGLNVSPTTSHPAGLRSASTSISSNSTPPYLQPTPPEKAKPHMLTNTVSNTSMGTKRRTRGNPDGPPVQADAHATSIDSIVTSTRRDEEADEVHREIIQLDSNDHLTTENSRQGGGSADSVHGVVRRQQSSRSENEQTESHVPEGLPRPSGRRSGKRKRSESMSVTPVSRNRMETAGEVDGEEQALPLHDELTYRAESEPDNLAPSAPDKDGQQMQTRVGGPASPHNELTLNGSNALKSRPRNFDRVIFGQYMIRTWYYSPYPISNVEDDYTSALVGPGRHTAAPSDVRGRVSKGGGTRNRARPQNAENGQSRGEDSMLWVCDKCFKYMQDGAIYELHSRNCDRMHPPGRKVYERGAHMIYEIDGAKDKLYCQNLSLFGKFFIDVKTLFYDCENFMFYVLTDGDRQQDHVIGFFSKEKVSYDDYNLACIITFPPWQRKRFGVLMIEFSYYLSRKEGKLGTPERPLSELGLRTYLTFWTGQLVQFFRRILSVQPFSDIPRDQQWPVHDDLIRLVEHQTPDRDNLKKRKKNGKTSYDHAARTEVWDFDIESEYNSRDVITATNGANDTLYKRMRWMLTSANKDGSVTIHVFARCTLQDMAVATGIRTEDIAFTLHEYGLLQKFQSLDRDGTEEAVIVSREMIEDVARRFNVKSKMCMELKYCLI